MEIDVLWLNVLFTSARYVGSITVAALLIWAVARFVAHKDVTRMVIGAWALLTLLTPVWVITARETPKIVLTDETPARASQPAGEVRSLAPAHQTDAERLEYNQRLVDQNKSLVPGITK